MTFNAGFNSAYSTAYQESGSDPTYSSRTRTDNTSYVVQLTELGSGQSGNYTLTTTETENHTFSMTFRNGSGTVSGNSSNNGSSLQTGSFGLADGNPYLPATGGVHQGGGQGVGVMVPWWGGGGAGQGGVPNRVTDSFHQIDPTTVFPGRTGNPTGGGLGLSGGVVVGNSYASGPGNSSSSGSRAQTKQALRSGTAGLGAAGGAAMGAQQGTTSGNGANNNSSPPELGPDPNQYRFGSYNPCNCSEDSTYSW